MIKKMSKDRFIKCGLTIGIAALLLISMVGVLSADPDEWDLDKYNDEDPPKLIMWHDNGHEESGSVTIYPGAANSKMWVANEPCHVEDGCH